LSSCGCCQAFAAGGSSAAPRASSPSTRRAAARFASAGWSRFLLEFPGPGRSCSDALDRASPTSSSRSWGWRVPFLIPRPLASSARHPQQDRRTPPSNRSPRSTDKVPRQPVRESSATTRSHCCRPRPVTMIHVPISTRAHLPGHLRDRLPSATPLPRPAPRSCVPRHLADRLVLVPAFRPPVRPRRPPPGLIGLYRAVRPRDPGLPADAHCPHRDVVGGLVLGSCSRRSWARTTVGPPISSRPHPSRRACPSRTTSPPPGSAGTVPPDDGADPATGSPWSPART